MLGFYHTSPGHSRKSSSKQAKNHSHLKFPDQDFDYPPTPVSSLSMEVYPFPILSVPKLSKNTPSVEITRNAVSEYSDKYERLSHTVSNKHPAMIIIMAELRRNYPEMEKWGEAEVWLRRELSARQFSGESAFSDESLSTQLELIRVIREQGRYEESRALHSSIHDAILNTKETRADTSLLEDSLENLVLILGDQSYLKDAGKHFLELLQIRLSYLGPRHIKTILSMQHVGANFRLQKQYKDSEKPTTITVQICREVSTLSERHTLSATNDLSNIRFEQGFYEESAALDRQVITSSKDMLGEDHPDTLLYMLNLAASLKTETILRESEELIRKTIARRIKTLGENNLDTLESIIALGHLLLDRGCYEEASKWYEKSFRGRLAYLGFYHLKTIWACNSLAYCYRSHSRFADALLLLEGFIRDIQLEISHRIKGVLGDEIHSEILPWIDNFKELADDTRRNHGNSVYTIS